MTAGDDDWLEVVGCLGEAQKSWGWLSWVLVQEGADPKVSGNFYNAVAQAVILFGAETWVLTKRTEKALDIFQSRVVRRITGKQPSGRKTGAGITCLWRSHWGEAGLEGIRKSITQRQNTASRKGMC